MTGAPAGVHVRREVASDRTVGSLVLLAVVVALLAVLAETAQTTLEPYVVTITLLSVTIVSIGFAAIFTIKNDLVACSRDFDGLLVSELSGRSAAPEGGSDLGRVRAAEALAFSAFDRDLAHTRGPPIVVLFYAGVLFTIAAVAWILLGNWLLWTGIYLGGFSVAWLASLTLLSNPRDVPAISFMYRLPPAHWSGVPPRWRLVRSAIRSDPALHALLHDMLQHGELPGSIAEVAKWVADGPTAVSECPDPGECGP